MSEREARLSIAAMVRPGDEALPRAVHEHGPEHVLHRLRAAGRQPPTASQVAEQAATLDARIIVPGDLEWPTTLDLAEVSPIALWVWGAANLRLLALRSVAVVGARAATSYGEQVARRWAGELAARGWVVISGGAFGIDAAAHRGALDAQGATVCVLACGVDVAYPRAHEALLASIADAGVVVSESPPGSPVRRQGFLWRNRLIAGLSRATVVVEATLRSGTASTANHAERFGRPVLAVPGPVSSPASAGCHALITSGVAVLADSVDAVIATMDPQMRQLAFVPAAGHDELHGLDRMIVEELPRRTTISAESIVAATGAALVAVLAALGRLELSGWAERAADGGWRTGSRVAAGSTAGGLRP